MSKRSAVKPMYSLSPVVFRNSVIAGRGVFARKPFSPGDFIVPYAPKQRRVDVKDPRAIEAAESKLTLLSGGEVIIPDTAMPGGWLCNHSCNPNAALYSSGAGRIQCTRPIAPTEEITIFYGWVSHNEPNRDPCRCGTKQCRGFINFDLSDEDAAHVEIVDEVEGAGSKKVIVDAVLKERLDEYARYLRDIGQEQVREAIAATLVRLKTREPGSVVCAY